MVSDSAAVVELLSGHTVDFGTSRIYSGRVHEMQRLGYFGDSAGRALRAEEVLDLEGELMFLRRSSLLAFACLCIDCRQSVAVFRSSNSIAHVECYGGAGKVYVGGDYVWWRALD
jgi:hypothetical protein